MVNEEFWDQRLARALILWSNLLASLFMLLEAVVSNWAVHWSLPSKRVAGLKHRRLSEFGESSGFLGLELGLKDPSVQ